ncbi:adenylate kinase family protein [Candidatus Woesearchaeota archaeon]|nr:adenylate kinase family protein [Candidatus Woesearchaeota archaeon]
MIIVVTGSPGTGKSYVAKRIAERYGYQYLDVNDLISRHKLSSGYDRKRRCRIIDVERLNRHLIREIGRHPNIVIDSHLSHYLPRNYVHLCLVTKCGLKELERRLARRGYPPSKVRENLDAEIFDTCYAEAQELGHHIMVIDTSNSKDVDYFIDTLPI